MRKEDMSLKQIKEVYEDLRKRYPSKNIQIVFDNGLPKVEVV